MSGAHGISYSPSKKSPVLLSPVLSVVPDRFHGTGIHRFLALGFLFRSLGLLENIGISLVFLPCEVERSRHATHVAVDALRVDVEFSEGVVRIPVVLVRHRPNITMRKTARIPSLTAVLAAAALAAGCAGTAQRRRRGWVKKGVRSPRDDRR